MAANEELAIILKALGAKDTEAALKRVSAAMRDTGKSGKDASLGAKASAAAMGELTRVGSGLSGQIGSVGAVMGALGPAGIAAAAGIGAVAAAGGYALVTLGEWTKLLINTTSALADQSAESGISTQALQEYAFVGRDVGVSQQQIADSVARASRTIAAGGDEVDHALGAIGLSMRELGGLAPEEQFRKISAGLNGIGDSGTQAAIAFKIFGRDTSILKVIRSDFEAGAAAAHSFGQVLDDATIARYDKLGDELGRLGGAWDIFKMAMADAVLGGGDASAVITELTRTMADVIVTARESKTLFADLYQLITGSTMEQQIAEFRNFLDLVKVGMFYWRELTGKKAASGPTQGLANTPQKPGGARAADSKAAAEAAKQEAEAIKRLANELRGATVSGQGLGVIERTLVSIGGASKVIPSEISKLGAALAQANINGAKLGTESQKVLDLYRRWSESARDVEEFNKILSEQREITALLGPSVQNLTESFLRLSASADGRGGIMGMTPAELSKYAAQLTSISAEAAASGVEVVGLADAVDELKAALGGNLRVDIIDPKSSGLMGRNLADAVAGFGTIQRSTAAAKTESIDWAKALDTVRNTMDVLGISSGSLFGKFLGGLSSAMAGIEQFQKAQKQGGIGGKIGMIGAGLSIAGTAVGLFKSLFGGDAKRKKELADLRKELLDSFGGSMEALQKKARELGVDISRAFSTKDPKELKRIMDQLNQAMEAQKKRLEGIKTAMAGLELRTKGFAAEMARGGDVTARQQESFQRLGAYAVATFAAMVRESGDAIGALQEMGGSLDELIRLQSEHGFTASATITKLLAMRSVIAANQDVADSISGLNQLMTGLGDANAITRDLFVAFGMDATELFNQLVERGTDSNTAMALMQPTLQRLWEGQRKFGNITDEATLALLREAEAQGLVGESMMSVNQQILEVLLSIGEALGATIPEGLRRMGNTAVEQFGRMGDAASGAASALGGLAGHGIAEGEPTPGGGMPVINGGFATGGTVYAPPSGAWAMVHGTEHIMQPAQFNALVSAAVARAVTTAVAAMRGSGGAGDVYLDGEIVGRHVERRLETNRIMPRRGAMRVTPQRR